MREIDLERMIHYEVSENIPQEGRKEIMSYLALKTLIEPHDVDKVWHRIACGNGILDLVTSELCEPNKEEKNTIAIPWNYVSDPQHSPKIDEFMAHISANRDGSVNIMKEQFFVSNRRLLSIKEKLFW